MSSTFYDNSGVTAVGNSFVGLVDTTNVQISPARENGNLATIAAALNVNLSTISTEVTLSALNAKFTTTANGIKVDATATTQPVSGTVNTNTRDGSGNLLTSTAGSLDVNITGGSTAGEQHTVDDAGDLYIAGTSKATVAGAHVVAAAPSLTAGQFSSLNVTLAGRLLTDGSGVTQPISVASLPLPTGAATEATLALINTNLDQLNYSGTRLLVDGSGVTQPVSGAVTANIGTSGALALDATLSAASAKLPTTLGQKTMANSLAVVLASDQSTVSINNAQWGGSATSLGQKAMAASVPVVLASDQVSIPVTQSGTWNINNVSGTVSLPTGAATEATLALINTNLDQLNYSGVRLLVDGSGATQPISATTLPLPSGAATSALQGTGNSSLASIDSKTLSAGQATMAASSPVVIASNQSAIPVTGTVTVTQGTGSNLNAQVSGIVTSNIGTTGGLALDATLTGGSQKTKLVDAAGVNTAAISGVGALKVDGSNSTQPISAAALPLPAGAATEGTLSAISSKLPTTLGQKTMANSTSFTIASDQSAVNVNITGSVAVNTNQAQWGGVATSLGQKTMTNSVPVTLASDQPNLTVLARAQDGTGNAITSTGGSLDVNITGGSSAGEEHTSESAGDPYIAGTTQGKVAIARTVSSAPTLVAGEMSAINVTTSGRLLTDGSGVTQPVSGTVTANAGTGSFTVAQATAGNLNATVVGTVTANAGTGSFTVSQATGTNLHTVVDSGSITANAGTGTFTVGQATGTNLHTVVDSGSITANIGTTGGLALEASVTGLSLTQGTSTVGERGILQLGGVSTSAPSYVTGEVNPLSLTTNGLLRVDGSGATQPISAASLPLPSGAATEATLAAVEADTTAIASSAASIDVKTPALVSGRVPVDGSGVTQPVSGTVTAVQATAGNLNATVAQSGTWNINNVSGTVSLPTGAATEATLSAVDVKLGNFTFASTRLLVDGSGVTQPISGTITANAGTGDFTVVQASAANLNATVTGTVAATQSGTWNVNNISGTVSLPTGAATETSLAKLTIAQGATLGTNTQALAGGSVTTAAPSYTTGQISPLSLTTSGALRVDTGSSSITVEQATPSLLNATVSQATGTNLHTVVDSGSITANIGTTNGLALNTTVAQLNVSQSTALGSNTGPMVQGSVSTNPASYVNGNINPLNLNVDGQLRVEPQGRDLSTTGTITALNGSVTLSTRSMETALIKVSGTWVASLQIQGLSPDGTTWSNLSAALVPSGNPFTSTAFTANGVYRILTAASYPQLRVTATAFTSGTVTVDMAVSDKQSISQVVQLIPSNMQVEAHIADGFKTSYSASAEVVASATATDIFTIYGSATKTIRVTYLAFTASQSTSANQLVRVIKRSTANTGGTSSNISEIPHDSTSAAATATVLSYTANPTLGTAIGTLGSHNVILPDDAPSGAGGSLPGGPYVLFTATRPAQAYLLRGTSEGLVVNLAGSAGGGNNYSFFVEWTEE